MNRVACLIIVALISSLNAAAAENVYRFKGAELASYGVQVEGPKRLVLDSDYNLKWVHSSSRVSCEELFTHSYKDRCTVSVVQPHSILINGFRLPSSEALLFARYKWGESLGTQELETMEREAQASIPREMLIQLADVKAGTTFWRDGSCFTKELRFFADDQTKVIADLWFERVASPCR